MNPKKWHARYTHLKELESLGWIFSYRYLKTLENRMHRYAEYYCNGIIDSEVMEKLEEKTLKSLTKGFGGKLPDGFFINQDPRGFALKIESESNGEYPNYKISQRDWGGYGILAPDF